MLALYLQYKYPGSKFTLRDDGQGTYIETWEHNTPKPELTILDLDYAKQIEDAYINGKKARDYIVATDWYITRNAENGTPIPDSVSLERAAARKRIVAARNLGLDV